ncbi:AbrB/MazE/SpoVT family DNA-binding domain-containing protein [Candidatus Woesearchaeota archaeon]|nr:AbrB/MazE/SpoVT family DNA-binding domain-containing protein [Candidatus Woesearchaeota archaeon]
MKRKVNLVGINTLTVSLPADFAKKNRIKKGDELFVKAEGNDVIYSVSEKAMDKKEITLNIDNFSYFTLSRYLTVFYRMNYSRIILLYSKQELFNDKEGKYFQTKSTIKRIVDRLIGAEILSQTCSRTEIEFFIADEKQELDKIERRVYFLIRETLDEILEAIKGNYEEFHRTIYDHHDNIVKFINYYLRELNCAGWSSNKKSMAYSVYVLLDKIIDNLRHLSESINEFGCSEKTGKYVANIFDLFSETFAILFKKEDYQSIIRKNYSIRNKMLNESFNLKEFNVISKLYLLTHSLSAFVELAIVKEIEDKKQPL